VNSPNPSPGLTPSASTNATAVGGALATLIIYGLSFAHITLPPGAEAAVAVLVASIAGWLPASGRK
jgi:hypothetical protein